MTDQSEEKAKDIVVVMALGSFTCAECSQEHGNGSFLTMSDEGPLCMSCAEMDHLEYLPSGNAALTRRAKKASGLSAVVVRFARARRRYERQGTLVESEALASAEEHCLADEAVRAARAERSRARSAIADEALCAAWTAELQRLFPGCSRDRAALIARRAVERGSGRVGRSAAGRSIEESPITLAVVASIRHLDTDYDELLMSGTPRADARAAVRAKVDSVLEAWRSAN